MIALISYFHLPLKLFLILYFFVDFLSSFCVPEVILFVTGIHTIDCIILNSLHVRRYMIEYEWHASFFFPPERKFCEHIFVSLSGINIDSTDFIYFDPNGTNPLRLGLLTVKTLFLHGWGGGRAGIGHMNTIAFKSTFQIKQFFLKPRIHEKQREY